MRKKVSGLPWVYVGHSIDSTSFMIDGIDVWKYDWMRTDAPRAQVKDPQHGQEFELNVYEITAGLKKVKFAAGEFSNCVWGFYKLKDYKNPH